MSDYKCEACGKYKKREVSQIGVGDKVNFAITTQPSSRTMRMSSKEGVVTEVNGDVLTIKVKHCRPYKLHRENVTPEGAPNALTYALFGRCYCSEENKA